MTERARIAAKHRFEKRVPAPERPLPKLIQHPKKPYEVWAVATKEDSHYFRWFKTWRVSKYATKHQAEQAVTAYQKNWFGRHYKMEIRYAGSERDK